MTAQTEETVAPDLLYSEAEDDLRAAVRSLLADRSDAPTVIARIESDTPYDPQLWKALGADIGAAGLLVPEKLGGQGAAIARLRSSWRNWAAAWLPPLPDQRGRRDRGTPCPGGEDGPVAELLGELAAGRKVAVLAVPFPAAPENSSAAEAVTGTLDGTVTAVADAAAADVLLVPTTDGLYAVEAAAPGVTVEPLVALDQTRPLATVTLTAATGTRLADAVAARSAVRRGLLAGAGLLASEQLGLAEWCLTETVRHTRERHQFNRPIGSFQALKHRMAQLWLEVVSARAAARNAADALATGSPDTPLAVAVAQAYCSKVAVHAAEECIQLHGGIGMTWEHPAHLYLKRAKADAIAYGTAGSHREAIAELMELPAP